MRTWSLMFSVGRWCRESSCGCRKSVNKLWRCVCSRSVRINSLQPDRSLLPQREGFFLKRLGAVEQHLTVSGWYGRTPAKSGITTTQNAAHNLRVSMLKKCGASREVKWRVLKTHGILANVYITCSTLGVLQPVRIQCRNTHTVSPGRQKRDPHPD